MVSGHPIDDQDPVPVQYQAIREADLETLEMRSTKGPS